MSIFCIPTTPNRPLTSLDDDQTYGNLRLRLNTSLDFMENAEFHQELVVYDSSYQNSQAYSSYFCEHMREILKILKKNFPKNSCIVEVGCGKGDFVELIQADGYFNISGYDATYEGKNECIHKRYITAYDNMKADVIVLRHVLEHIKAPHTFLLMLKQVFHNAAIYIEVPNADWIIENQAFFDITYEHVNYFSQKSLLALFDSPEKKQGLCFNKQYQYIIANINSISNNFVASYNSNFDWQYIDFDNLFPNLFRKILEIEACLDLEGSKCFIWGAATKGCMFLIHCAIQNKLLDKISFAVDTNPNKSGKYLPGSLIPIKGEEAFFKEAKAGDVLIISNPNYKQEIINALRTNGLDCLTILCL